MSKELDLIEENKKYYEQELADMEYKLFGIKRTETKDQQIADLEAKLAESENKHLLDETEWQDYCAFKHIEPEIRGCLDREREYKQQLAMQENTIINLVEDNRASQEWYKKQLAETEAQNKRVLEKLDLLVRSNQELEKENELMAKTLKMTKFVEKEVSQDKISFAVEQLEKVKELVEEKGAISSPFGNLKIQASDVSVIIDNQIKQLKEGKQYGRKHHNL